jgi:RNA polymerase sigma factor (sigma-70 family)
MAFDQALGRLEGLDARKAEVARLRSLWGLSMDEIAGVLGISEPTVRRDWRFARTWLAEALGL